MASATILIVEDNYITSKMMRVTIKTKGYTLLEALDGKTALTMAEEHQPDLIFVNLLLSDMDGLVLTRLLRRLPACRHTPIVAVSGLQSKLDESLLMRDGFTNFLFKPVTPDTLLEMIEHSLPRAGAAQDVHPHGRSMLLVDDDQIQGKFQRLHFEALGYHVTFAHDVETALRVARDAPPDVIVADLIMPRMNGLDLCTQVRQVSFLAHIPIVLTSSTFALVGPDELKMAHDAGANTFAPRTPTLQELGQAVLSCLGQSPPLPAPNISTLKEEYECGLLRQLEHQARLNQHLLSRCALQSLQLTIHEAVADSLATKPHLADALNEALARLLHASGASFGAVYVLKADGSLPLHSLLGFQGMTRHDAQNFFGHIDLLRVVLTRGCVVKLPSTEVDLVVGTDLLKRAGVAHMLIIPLIANSVPNGALVLSSSEKEVEAIWASAGQTIGTQLARTVALAQALTRVRESEERYRGLVAATSQIVWTLTSSGMAVEDAPTWRHYSGQSLEEFQNQSWTSVVHHDDQIGVMKDWKLAHLTSTLFEVVCRLRAAQGNYGIFHLRIVPILDLDGHVREWIGACTDITAKIQAEEERDRCFTQARDLIGLVGFDGYFKRLNPAWEACLKFTLDELMAEPYIHLIHPDDVESFQKEVQRLSTGVETISFEIRWLRKDGSHKWIQLNATSLVGQPVFYAYGRDITEQKWLEIQLRQAQ
ncbi:MAG: response regulator, partial [Nitrospirota bacterium]